MEIEDSSIHNRFLAFGSRVVPAGPCMKSLDLTGLPPSYCATLRALENRAKAELDITTRILGDGTEFMHYYVTGAPDAFPGTREAQRWVWTDSVRAAEKYLGPITMDNREQWEDRLDTALRDMRRLRPVETTSTETQ
jgi:hypothetical protein